jgi:bifunctional enzyme CysN/CysC
MPDRLVRVIACGSVDDGKSTLIGRLLHEQDAIPDDVRAALAQESKQYGTVQGGTDYALLVDGLAAEREQGITIDVAYRYFDTPHRHFILADAPGHEQYTRNMVTAASVADIAILLVDARHGVVAQTRRHAAILSLFGCKQIVLAVNKMDLVGFDASVIERIAGEFIGCSSQLGQPKISAVPVCATDGDTIVTHGKRMDWYTGPTLLECLEQGTVDERPARPFRMHVQWVNRADQDFRGYAGTILDGVVRPGDEIINVTHGTSTIVSRIVTMMGDLGEAGRGDPVTLVVDPPIDISRGDVLARPPLPGMAQRLDVRMVWMNEEPLVPGHSYQILIGTRTVLGSVTEISHRLSVDTLEQLPARSLNVNEIGRVILSLAQPVAFEPYAVSREMGSLILVDRTSRATVGVGMVEGAAGELHWQMSHIDKAARAALKGQKPAVLWFTGLSGAGKSTIANLVEKRLHMSGRHTILLDGDNIRQGLNSDLGFTEADRAENIRRLAEVARLFLDAGLIVLVAFISPYRAGRVFARTRVEEGEFIEIYVDTPIEECRRRDPKGLYAKADAKLIRDFTGVDAPYEVPSRPEIHLQTIGASVEALAEQVLLELSRRGITD